MKDGVPKVTQIIKERRLKELVNTGVGEVPPTPSLDDRIQEPEVNHHQIARLQERVLMLSSHILDKSLEELPSTIRTCGKRFSKGPPSVANGLRP